VTWRISTDHKRTADEYFVWLSSLIALTKAEVSITEAIISSTVPRVVFNLRVLCNRYFECRPVVVGKPECRLPMQPRVDQGATVGPDRLVNTAGAFDRHGGNLIVVDFGTATTFDYIGPDGSYRGGSIAPGVNLSLDALYAAAAMLPRIAIEPPPNESVIGTTTVGQMQIGIYWGYVAMIEGMIARMKAEIGEPVSVIATGGLAILFQQHGHLFDRVEPDLTLRGLALLYRNRELT
jgi:type III pantothenate kinase